jgi:hypothetical protein
MRILVVGHYLESLTWHPTRSGGEGVGTARRTKVGKSRKMCVRVGGGRGGVCVWGGVGGV